MFLPFGRPGFLVVTSIDSKRKSEANDFILRISLTETSLVVSLLKRFLKSTFKSTDETSGKIINFILSIIGTSDSMLYKYVDMEPEKLRSMYNLSNKQDLKILLSPSS